MYVICSSESELAYQAVKQCMVEDPRLLFRPLLNGFNKLYQEISDKKSQLPHTVFSKSLVRQLFFLSLDYMYVKILTVEITVNCYTTRNNC